MTQSFIHCECTQPNSLHSSMHTYIDICIFANRNRSYCMYKKHPCQILFLFYGSIWYALLELTYLLCYFSHSYARGRYFAF